MGVDCDPVAGIGFELNEENMRKFGAKKWLKRYQQLEEDEGGYDKKENSWGEDDYIIEELLEGVNNISHCTSGSYYSGHTYKWLCTVDEIFGVEDFVKDCNKVGFNIKKTDLVFFSETLWC